MNAKYNELLKYSDPQRVKVLAKQFLGKDVPLYVSTRKDKKYMVFNPDGKKVHFGQMGFQDFSKHLDLERRDRFVSRNKKWKDAPMWTPAWLSFYLLWT